MDLKALAQETLAIVHAGEYVAPSGRRVALPTAECVARTRTWTPEALERLLGERPRASAGAPAPVEVTDESTGAAARRLTGEGESVLALNFASARRVGGGFLTGARAQEEDLCRSSALFACLEPQQVYYRANRAHPSSLYTDHLIHSPAVPFFRDEALRLLEAPFPVSVLTAPAPCNRPGDLSPAEQARLPEVFERRAGLLLALAAAEGHRCLVLGAWGCGAFRNDPVLVADVFARWLAHPAFAGAFARVVFAVLDRSRDQANLSAFRARLGS